MDSRRRCFQTVIRSWLPSPVPGVAARSALFALMTLIMVSSVTPAQSTGPSVTDIRLGFQFALKPGFWIPVAVDLETDADVFQGQLELIVPDADDLNTTIVRGDLYFEPHQRETVYHFVKLGGPDANVTAQLRDTSGKVVARGTLDLTNPNQSHQVLDATERLIVSIGSPSGLLEASRNDKVAQEEQDIAALLFPAALPVQWVAYDSVDSLILATSDASLFDQLDPVRASALDAWIRQGGHLVLSVANNWQLISENFLGPMLPARLEGLDRIREPDTLEVFADAARFNVGPSGLPIAQLADVRGRVLVESGGRPLVVAGSYGLGTVTLLAFDTDAPPFQAWPGRDSFWIKLLGLRRVGDKSEQDSATASFAFAAISDASSLLYSKLEEFPNVTVVPFGWVALLIFGYILLIGPIDYFLLKKVVGKLEWTWVTFPFWVVLVSVAAYYTAYWLKGDDLCINRVEIVDIEPSSQTLRGSSFLSIFSPRIDRYTIALEPELAAQGSFANLVPGDQADRNSAWLGLPEEAFRGNYNTGSVGLLGRRGYQYESPRATALIDVPIQVWSVKAFHQRWLAQAAPVFDADLVERPDALGIGGTLTNRLDVPLADLFFAHGMYACEIKELKPGATVELAGQKWVALEALLRQKAVLGDANNYMTGPNTELDAIVRTLLFAGRRSENLALYPSHYLKSLDLSGQLDRGKAIVVAKVPQSGARLWLGALPGTQDVPPAVHGVEQVETFLRVLLEPKKATP